MPVEGLRGGGGEAGGGRVRVPSVHMEGQPCRVLLSKVNEEGPMMATSCLAQESEAEKGEESQLWVVTDCRVRGRPCMGVTQHGGQRR